MAAKPLVATGAPAAKTAAKACCTFGGKALEEALKTLPHGYGCVVSVGLAGVFVNIWMAKQVGNARKELNVKYPLMYSPENNFDNKFNCIQRAHQNSLEFQPTFYFLLMTGGFACPCFASIFGTAYLVGRIKYFKDYSTGDPKKRLTGFMISQVALLGLAALVGKLLFHFFRSQGCCICHSACKILGKK
jgi:glutathione S-transferase